ncbi:hypothetical protein SprV_0200780800 [Sparganum proliferum]
MKVHSSLHIHAGTTTGKRPRQPVTATATAVQSRPSRLFYISDKSSGLRFPVDTGVEISVIPPPRLHHLKPLQFSLQAANSTTINTYGQRSLPLDIGLRRRFQWVFVQADVKSPITGADFLTHFGLAVDHKHRKLAETTTTIFTVGIAASEPSISIQLTVSSSHFADILKDYSSVTKPYFLAHHVDQHGITPLIEKVQSILSFPVPKTLTRLRRFIGLLNYYRHFIRHCAATLAPLTDLLKSKAKPIELSSAAHSAFEAAKNALADATLLHHLSSDPHAQLILTTDASNSALGAVLHQQVNNQLQSLAFFSRKLQPAQARYGTFSRELLAIYLAICHFRHLLEGRDFSVHIDHKRLTYALKVNPDRYSSREVRHLDYILQVTADIRYVRGSDDVVADALSRPDINILTSDFHPAKLADLQSGDKSIDDLRSTTTLQLRDAPLPASLGTILCDWSTGTPRLVVPLSYRKTVFDHFHSLLHRGIHASRKLIADRFIWAKMNSDIAHWTRQCLACQKNKVRRHTFSPSSTFAVPNVRFHHVHLDLVGPLPPSRGNTHILTAVDRFTRWPIAVPITDTSAENIAMVFLTHWISTFGVPATFTTDRGSQFQSSLYREFTRLLGCAHITTTAYHPASNGLVERLRRQLKSALMSQTESAAWKEDIQCNAAELVYGAPLRLHGEFVQSSTTTTNIPSTFVQQLKQRMAQLRPTPTRLTSKRVFVHEDLKSAPFVFVRHDTVCKSLCSSYDGPYRVLQRMDKYYVIRKADKTDTVSIDRLNPAYLECIPLSMVPPTSSAPSSSDPPVSVPSTRPLHSITPPTHPDSSTTAPRTSSRSGEVVHGLRAGAVDVDARLRLSPSSQSSIPLIWRSITSWHPTGLQAETRLGADMAVVRPAIGVPDRFGHHHVLSISPPDESTVQQLPTPRPGVHPGHLLPNRLAEESVGQQESVFSATTQKKETTVVAATDPVRTQHSPSSSEVCPDAVIWVTKVNQHVRLQHRRQKVVIGHWWSVGADYGGNLGSTKELPQAHQSFDYVLRQTGQSSHDVVPKGKGDARVSSICLGAAAPEDVAGTHFFQLTFLGEPSLAEFNDVHLVPRHFSSE